MPTSIKNIFATTTTDWCGKPLLIPHETLPDAISNLRPFEPVEWKCAYCASANVLAECTHCGAPKPLPDELNADAVLQSITDTVAEGVRELLKDQLAEYEQAHEEKEETMPPLTMMQEQQIERDRVRARLLFYGYLFIVFSITVVIILLTR